MPFNPLLSLVLVSFCAMVETRPRYCLNVVIPISGEQCGISKNTFNLTIFFNCFNLLSSRNVIKPTSNLYVLYKYSNDFI